MKKYRSLNVLSYLDCTFILWKFHSRVYLVDIETSHYIVFDDNELVSNPEYPEGGDDFFADAKKNAGLFIHPDDLEFMVNLYNKDEMLSNLSENGVYTTIFRAVVNGRIYHCELPYPQVCQRPSLEQGLARTTGRRVKTRELPLCWDLCQAHGPTPHPFLSYQDHSRFSSQSPGGRPPCPTTYRLESGCLCL